MVPKFNRCSCIVVIVRPDVALSYFILKNCDSRTDLSHRSFFKDLSKHKFLGC